MPIDFNVLKIYIQYNMLVFYTGVQISMKWGRIHGQRVDSFDESDHGI